MSNTLDVILLGSKVALLPTGKKETSSGLIIPDSAESPTLRCEVVAVGPGDWDTVDGGRRKMQAKVGDKVLIGRFAGTIADIDEQEYIIAHENEIILIFR